MTPVLHDADSSGTKSFSPLFHPGGTGSVGASPDGSDGFGLYSGAFLVDQLGLGQNVVLPEAVDGPGKNFIYDSRLCSSLFSDRARISFKAWTGKKYGHPFAPEYKTYAKIGSMGGLRELIGKHQMEMGGRKKLLQHIKRYFGWGISQVFELWPVSLRGDGRD